MVKALFFEGCDSVGKNDAFRNVATYALRQDPNRKLVLMNFPQYWFFGHDIRLMQRGACDELIKSFTGVEDIAIRASMYGLDRDIALMLAQSYFEKGDYILLSDRGPYSSCNTTGYVWANNKITKKEIESEIIPDVFEISDWGMLSYLDHKSVLLSRDSSAFDMKTRKALDNYESELPQKHAYEAYKMSRLPEVVTKVGDEWKQRYEILSEIVNLSEFFGTYDPSVMKNPFDSQYLYDAYKSGRLVLIGPETLLRHFDMWDKVDTKLKKKIEKWTYISLGEDALEQRDRKEVLDDLETKIALELKRLTGKFDYAATPPFEHTQKAISRLLDRYPLIYSILKQTSGERMITFLNGILGSGQLQLDL